MKLKTYTAETMAQALAQVRKDLGKDAMILHTRSFRVGSWFGLGGKTMVEITASSQSASAQPKAPRAMPRVAPRPAPAQRPEYQPVERQPEIVIQRGATVTRQRLAHAPVSAQTQERAQGRAQVQAQVQVQEETDHQTQGFEPATYESLTPKPLTPKPIVPADTRGLGGRDALFGDDSSRSDQSMRRTGRKPSGSIESKPSRFINQPIAQSLTEAMIPKNKPVAQAPAPTLRAEPLKKQQSKIESKLVQSIAEPETTDELRNQIDSLQKMMGQVLESTRKTAVAVGTGNTENALPAGEMPAPLFSLYAKMIDNDVPVDQADKLIGSVRDRLDAVELKDPMIVRQAMLRAIESTILTRSESLLTIDHTSQTGRPRVIALVGPTGVGKTTTVAKLAATYKLRHGKKVGLVTSDTYRIAAVEQLRTYAGIIGLPLKIANSPEELARSIEELSDCDIVVIDTAGRSQNNARRLEELAEFTAAASPDETHLVLSTTVGDNVLRKTAERFKALGPDRCILTKLDEAVTTGPIAGLSDRIGLPLSFITVGQEVPDDLEPARADRLARCVLDGPEAVVRRCSEDNG